MDNIQQLSEKYAKSVVVVMKDAWTSLAHAIVAAAPVKVGDTIRDEDGLEYQIARVRAVDWDNDARYEVRKKTANGWHKTQMTVGGLSSAINKGRFTFINRA